MPVWLSNLFRVVAMAASSSALLHAGCGNGREFANVVVAFPNAFAQLADGRLASSTLPLEGILEQLGLNVEESQPWAMESCSSWARRLRSSDTAISAFAGAQPQVSMVAPDAARGFEGASPAETGCDCLK